MKSTAQEKHSAIAAGGILICLLIILAMCASLVSAANEAVQARFENRTAVPPAINPYGPQSSSAAFFSGTTDSRQVPGSDAFLFRSSFGQPLAAQVPFPDFIHFTLNHALAKVYCEYTTEAECLSVVAFRYKTLLYGSEEQDSEIFIRAQFDSMADYWDEAARNRAMEAAEYIKGSLRYAPWDRTLRHALLDIYYDTAVADLALAREKRIEALQITLELLPSPPETFLISKEIELLEQALSLYRNTMKAYFDLLNDPMGIDSATVTTNPDQQDLPFGYYLFQTEVPARSPLSPLFKDGQGNWVLPIDKGDNDVQIQLFEGYKDLVLLFKVHKEYARTAADLAKRYILRGQLTDDEGVSDLEKAANLIGSVQQQAHIEGHVLLNIFPGINDNGEGADSQSGLVESVAAWRDALSQLQFFHAYLAGETNLIGFTDDFLVLVQSVIPGDPQSVYFDSYNFFKEYMNKESDGPLYNAVAELARAKSDYVTYRGYLDQLATQFHDKSETYDSRLRAIVGVRPGEAGYETPEKNTGSEIWQQHINIEMARLKIEKNAQEVEDLQKQIEIEVWRRGEEHNVNNAISQVYLDYGEKQAKLTKEIAKITAAQAAANSILSAVSGLFSGNFFQSALHAANAAFQYGSEIKKGSLSAEKERLGARQSASLQSLNDNLLDITSQAQIKTWLLRMNTLALESMEAALILEQEIGRLTALYQEKEDLERRKDEHNRQLTERYFADPSHRLLKDNSVLRADLAFQNAQKWLYLTVRAAEYKWNQPFSYTYLGKNYTRKTLLKLCNARELQDMFNAIAQWDASISVGARSDDAYKKFSFRQDVLGYYNGNVYPDPVSGAMVQPWEALQSYLGQEKFYLEPWDADNPIPGFKVLKLNFSTAFMPETGNFFLMNRWLEKIQYMRVKVFGGAVGGTDSTIDGYLVYGDSSFIRNQYRGTPDPLHPDQLQDEITVYATRYWRYDSSAQRWKTENRYGSQAFHSMIQFFPLDTFFLNFPQFKVSWSPRSSVL
jgi:hypothetical protein